MAGFFIGLINLIIKALGAVLGLIFSLLPPSPFKVIDNSPLAPYIHGFNYIIPVSSIVTILEAWLLAVGGFYLRQIVLRWIKAVD